ncbi:MAG: hypothetical protein V2A56_06040 [bacterium]
MKPDPVHTKNYLLTTAPPRNPMDARNDMVGQKDISRHERAEESIREYFRQFLRKFSEFTQIDRKA